MIQNLPSYLRNWPTRTVWPLEDSVGYGWFFQNDQNDCDGRRWWQLIKTVVRLKTVSLGLLLSQASACVRSPIDCRRPPRRFQVGERTVRGTVDLSLHRALCSDSPLLLFPELLISKFGEEGEEVWEFWSNPVIVRFSVCDCTSRLCQVLRFCWIVVFISVGE